MPRTTLPLALRKRLQSLATSVRKAKGAVLFRAGQPCRGAFLIRSGQVELSRRRFPPVSDTGRGQRELGWSSGRVLRRTLQLNG
jgi:hypothetical protein